MPYIYRVSRRLPSAEVATVTSFTTPVPNPQPVPNVAVAAPETVPQAVVEPDGTEPSYRDLQAEAKALGISGNQKAGKLKKAIAEAKRNG